MAQPLYRQLLRQARRLARLDPTRPQQANLRRAISSSYYSLFHFLVDQATRFLVGTSGDRELLRKIVSRAFVHSEMAAASKTFSGGTFPTWLSGRLRGMHVPRELRELAKTFLDAQDFRHRADYDLTESFSRKDVIRLIDDIERHARLDLDPHGTGRAAVSGQPVDVGADSQ